jgi:RNA polymerase sigma-70 factor (ECF subfamily)
MASFRGESRFGTWIHRIAINQALMLRRASRRRPVQSLEMLPPAAVVAVDAQALEGPCELVDRRRLVERMYDALNQLEPAIRVALVLRDLEELSAEEAADILGISPAAVRQRAHRARLKLRELLGDVYATALRPDASYGQG